MEHSILARLPGKMKCSPEHGQVSQERVNKKEMPMGVAIQYQLGITGTNEKKAKQMLTGTRLWISRNASRPGHHITCVNIPLIKERRGILHIPFKSGRVLRLFKE
jgi:hypothetical protein